MGIEILEYFQNLLAEYNVDSANIELISRIILGVIVVLVSITATYLSRWIIRVPLKKLAIKSKAKWDDRLFERKLPNRVSRIVPAVIVYQMLPLVLPDDMIAYHFFAKLSIVYIVAEVMRTMSGLISFAYDVTVDSEKFKDRSMKGIFQVLQMLMIFIGVLVIIAVMIDESVGTLIAGLGASAAILTLIFKDSFVGLIAGIQLSYNDMLRPGDWITMPKHGADGVVFEVNLTTVKVRNWDNTIVTVPPYTLVSDSFQNWRGMFESGGRRIKRSINIDMTSVRFCTAQEIEEYRKRSLVYEDDRLEELTNITMLRRSLMQYLMENPRVNQDLMVMVRQLQPTPHGMPLELYFFSANKQWVAYEILQADVFDYVMALVPSFGLKVFQSPMGEDMKNWAIKE